MHVFFFIYDSTGSYVRVDGFVDWDPFNDKKWSQSGLDKVSRSRMGGVDRK